MGRPQSLQEGFEQQALATPDRPALVFGDERLTYRELRAEAHRVAWRLRELGVRRETLVAMAFPRSADAVVCLLGIVLAGGAYLPVNPDFPAERLAGMLGDSRTPLTVCAPQAASALAAALPEGVALHRFDDLLGAAPQDEHRALLPQEASPDSLAYVMYTSGSTGRPKGVMVEHQGVVRLVKETDYFDFSSDERFLLTGALEFDASTFEIWGALLNGATLHIVGEETLVVPERLKRALREADATVLWLTTPLFHQLVDEDVTLFDGLGTLLVGGDTVSCPHVNKVLGACPGLRLLNCYGPTENTTFTTVFPVSTPPDTAVPIGRPIAGTTVRVLDDTLRPVAPGRIGELFTAGLGLARGYLHNPEATTASFVDVDGERHYRTGDLVSADATGVLSFHGRTDDQVKIRGHRVEVKEVNSALLDVPGVRDAYTAVRDPGNGNGKCLIAYAVLDTGCDEHTVLAELRRRLPAYMCPDRVTALPRLPLNANGKVDAVRLPAPAAARPRTERLGPEEDRLARLWADVLATDAELIGPESDFFELGGTSITAGALIGRIARGTGGVLSFQDLFATRTLRAMARAVASGGAEGFTAIPAIPDAAGEGPLPLHPQQRGLYALWQSDEKSLAYNIPVRLDISGHLEPDRLRSALKSLTERHEALHTRFFAEGDTVHQIVERTVEVALDIAVNADVPTDEAAVERLVRPFDLARAPLLRALLVTQEHGDDRLYLDIHHIVFDGVSLALLVDGLLDLYVGVTPGEPATTYAAAAAWLNRELGAGGRFATDGQYWQERFRDIPEPLDLPTDHPRATIRSTQGAVVRRELGQAVQQEVAHCAAAHAVTDFSVLLVAYATVLARISGQQDLVVGCPVSGRVHPDLDGVIGMFVNTLPLRLRIDDATTITELLGQSGREHRTALTHQAYPFEQLVRQLLPRRDLSRTALFDAFFALQNIDFYTFRKHGRRVRLTLPHQGTARFDLNLQAYQRPEGLCLELEYSTALFTRQSAATLLDQIVAATDEVLHAPDHLVLAPVPAAAPAPVVPAADFAY
ncbi:amino acid adenylation domain-containing protein [Streptomyces sp. NPDC059897]|uniref:amino acid adenylation domain-containing protein n=1 Tax=Streptomyces sp. NPDC059897 TaxID=3346994 RepID=UPI00364C414E